MSKLNDLLSKIIVKVNGHSTEISQLSADIEAIGTQEEIVQQVIAALGTPVFGTVDDENNIVLSGNLADETYTVQYENADGSKTVIGTLTIAGLPTYTNVLKSAVALDGSPYNGGLGYRNGYRYSSSSGGDKQGDGYSTTGYIAVAKGDVIYCKNVGMNKNTTDNNNCQVYLFDSLKATSDGSNNASTMTSYNNAKWDANGQITQFTMDLNGYIRLNTAYLGEDSIITRNEPIE